MKRLILSLSFIWVFAFFIFGKPVDYKKAEQVARNYIISHTGFLPGTRMADYDVVKSTGNADEISGGIIYFHVFHTIPEGFVIIAGDDRVFPVIAYSPDGYFDVSVLPVNVLKWVDMYKKEIGYIVENNIEATEEIDRAWQKYENKDAFRESVVIAVDPLVKTKWNQWPHYNALCPGGSPTGCTATATAQVMKYWNHPAKGTGFHSYNHATYGTLSANFGNTSYQWAQMPNEVNSANNAVATLMFHVGIGMDMNYTPQGSNAHVISYNGQRAQCAEEALKKYFGYKPTLKGIEKKNYTDAHWVSLIKTELDKSRPVIYAGWSQNAGHAFVCDGYDNNNYFHFNWGWGGAYDGYFILTTLNPGSGAGFINYQQMITGIEPVASNQTYSLKLSEKVKVSPSPMTFGHEFTVKTNITNSGGGTFNGDFCAAVFDDSWNFIDYAEIKTNLTLTGNSSFSSSLVFANAGLLSMLPGDYYIGIYYKAQGTNEWQRVADNGSYVNFVPHRVYFAADIELYTDMTVTPGVNDLVEGKPAKVVVNVVNDGFATFKGWYSADLYDLNGYWVANFGMLYESHGLYPGSYYLAPYLQFETQNLEAPPGTYFLAIHYKPVNKEWSLAGSSYHANPIYVIVKEAAIAPDAYEPNNTAPTAYNLPVTFINNKAEVSTDGSNCHVVNDYDYYKIDLQGGYRYLVTARIHDSYASENGIEYTADVMFSTSTNGTTWSETYDDVMYQSVQLLGPQTLYFHVVPFFEGVRGTYLLDIVIQRFPLVAAKEARDVPDIVLYPNPASDFIHLEISNPAWVKDLKLFNMIGQEIPVNDIIFEHTIKSVPLYNLENGTYMLVLSNGIDQVAKKVVVCHQE